MSDTMKPLKDYAPFKIGERFEDEEGDVLEIVSSDRFAWVVVDGIECNRGPWPITDDAVKPIDRTSEALEELAQLDADDICGPKPWRDMTDDEKAPILLAWADGKSIEWWDEEIGSWCAVLNGPQGWKDLAYRIAPEDVRKEPREFWVYRTEGGALVAGITQRDDAIHVREVLK